MNIDGLTGTLLDISENKDTAKQKAWRTRGAAFQSPSRKASSKA